MKEWKEEICAHNDNGKIIAFYKEEVEFNRKHNIVVNQAFFGMANFERISLPTKLKLKKVLDFKVNNLDKTYK